MGMSLKMIAFVDQLILNKGDQTKAYLSEGYKVKCRDIAVINASRLLKNAKVQRLLQFHIEETRRRANIQIRQQRVVEELNSLAYSDLTDVLSWDCEGNITVKPSDELPPEISRTIKKVKITRTEIPQEDGEPVVKINFEIEQHDKKGSLEILSRASKLVDHQKPVAAGSVSIKCLTSKSMRAIHCSRLKSSVSVQPDNQRAIPFRSASAWRCPGLGKGSSDSVTGHCSTHP